MVFNPERILSLLRIYTERQVTPEEQRELMDWLAGYEDDGTFQSHIQQLLQDFPAEEKIEGVDWEKIYSVILTKRNTDSAIPVVPVDRGGSLQSTTHRVHFLKTSWFRYAAAVVVLLGGVGSYFWLSERQPETVVTTNGNKQLQTDIAPGTNRAILTVGDQTIDLSTNKTGIAIGNAITYNDGERIAEAGQLLQLTTPRGGQYQAVLPDGSKVWLNAASSIKFPSKFTGFTREVEITGEAYLEVAQNVKQSFVVKAGGTDIQVLGTSFNVNAYPDENMVKTTLVEGSVKVWSGRASATNVEKNNQSREVLLRPGQEAVYTLHSQQLIARKADMQQALAWRNGLFSFNNLSLQQILRQLSRWYDIDVEYRQNAPSKNFNGEIQRDLNLSEVLDVLKEAGVHFIVDDKKIIVLP